METKELGIYIHIPFCKRKCYYCDFISYSNKDMMIERYVNCLKKEIKKENRDITTIYIGGGTPSNIDSKYIVEILEKIKSNNNLKSPEITIEVNPGTITESKLRDYKKAGINRISIGLQSTNDNILTHIGRIHTYKEFLNTYNLARNKGFKNINIDLMIGLPNQTINDLKDSLEKVINLSPNHISVYSLIVEEGTKMYDMVNSGEANLPDEDLERQMYWYVKNMLELNGYNHYEISNFAKKGYESKHNINCWEQKEYIGIGAAAHSYFNKVRYSNTIDLNQYITNIEKNKMLDNKIIEEKLTENETKKEYMVLGLRKIDGISIDNFKRKFGENPLYLFKNELQNLTSQKLIKVVGDNIKLTNKGLDFANIVWREFV